MSAPAVVRRVLACRGRSGQLCFDSQRMAPILVLSGAVAASLQLLLKLPVRGGLPSLKVEVCCREIGNGATASVVQDH